MRSSTTPEEARAAAEKIGGRVVVKAQVKTGGRGKAGGVKLAGSPDEAEEKAREILGLDIKGHVVKILNIVPAAAIAEEYYFSFLVDRANRNYLCIASRRRRHGDRGGRAHQPGRGRADLDRPGHRGGRGEGRARSPWPRSTRPT